MFKATKHLTVNVFFLVIISLFFCPTLYCFYLPPLVVLLDHTRLRLHHIFCLANAETIYREEEKVCVRLFHLYIC